MPAAAPPTTLLDVRRILHEPDVEEFATGREVLARFPEAEREVVPSHWQIPGLHGNEGNAARWNRVKRETLVLGSLKSPRCRPNGRSSDFIAPSLSNGCAMSCAYCYVPRRKGYANPISVFVNTERVLGTLERHVHKQGLKLEPDQCDPEAWVYDLGENSDLGVDALVSSNPRRAVELFRELPSAKASFATKFVNRDLLDWDPQGRTRIRFSLMPPALSRLVDVRTTPVAERLAAIDDFVTAGYEVHVNLSPVIVHDGWLESWDELLGELDAAAGPAAKAQMAAEVIFLTHNEGLHEVNLAWHPRAEEVLWRPGVQEAKRSQNGQRNVRYRRDLKRRYLDDLLALVHRRTPWLRVRYAF